MTPSPSPEDRLDDLLVERRRELDEPVPRLVETVTGLERREELVRDSRASVERVLRMGATDLDLKESELAEQIRDNGLLGERLRAGEANLAQRPSELGAVELKREAVERRERALAEREARIAEREQSSRADQEPPPRRRARVRARDLLPARCDRPDPARPWQAVRLDGDPFDVARLGPSPLPTDNRRCAYLVRGVRGVSSDGSS